MKHFFIGVVLFVMGFFTALWLAQRSSHAHIDGFLAYLAARPYVTYRADLRDARYDELLEDISVAEAAERLALTEGRWKAVGTWPFFFPIVGPVLYGISHTEDVDKAKEQLSTTQRSFGLFSAMRATTYERAGRAAEATAEYARAKQLLRLGSDQEVRATIDQQFSMQR